MKDTVFAFYAVLVIGLGVFLVHDSFHGTPPNWSPSNEIHAETTPSEVNGVDAPSPKTQICRCREIAEESMTPEPSYPVMFVAPVVSPSPSPIPLPSKLKR